MWIFLSAIYYAYSMSVPLLLTFTSHLSKDGYYFSDSLLRQPTHDRSLGYLNPNFDHSYECYHLFVNHPEYASWSLKRAWLIQLTYVATVVNTVSDDDWL